MPHRVRGGHRGTSWTQGPCCGVQTCAGAARGGAAGRGRGEVGPARRRRPRELDGRLVLHASPGGDRTRRERLSLSRPPGCDDRRFGSTHGREAASPPGGTGGRRAGRERPGHLLCTLVSRRSCAVDSRGGGGWLRHLRGDTAGGGECNALPAPGSWSASVGAAARGGGDVLVQDAARRLVPSTRPTEAISPAVGGRFRPPAGVVSRG